VLFSLCACVCVSLSGVLFSVSVCVCDLLIFLHIPHVGLDETASGMDVLKNKMKALLPKKEPKQKMAILILSGLLILLLVLVVYT